MTNSNNSGNSAARHWKMSAIGGVVVAVLLMVLKGASLSSAVLWGAVVAVVAGFLLTRLVGNADVSEMATEAEAELERVAREAAAAASAAAPQPVEEPEPVAEPVAAETAPEPEAPAQVSASGIVKPSKSLPGQEELAARKGTWRYQGADT